MQTKIFKGISKAGKPYWYIPATNYKDKNDKLNYYVSFTKDSGYPTTEKAKSQSGFEYEYAEIDVLQMYFGCFGGKPQITIAKWVAKNNQKQSNTFYASEIDTNADDIFDF